MVLDEVVYEDMSAFLLSYELEEAIEGWKSPLPLPLLPMPVREKVSTHTRDISVKMNYLALMSCRYQAVAVRVVYLGCF